MINRLLNLTIAIVVLCGTNGLVRAQNPLRRNDQPNIVNQTPRRAELHRGPASINPPDVTPEELAAINNRLYSEGTSSRSGQTPGSTPTNSPLNVESSDVTVDHNVAPATHLAKPKNDLAPIMNLLDSLPNRVPADNLRNASRPADRQQPALDRVTNPLNLPQLQTGLRPAATEAESADNALPADSLASPKQFDREKFQALIKQLAINTGIVMCMGIGFILVAKQYFKAKSPRQKSKTESPIQITSTLKLSPKSNLHLIEAGEHRLIVATDQNGIKSMVRLTDSFANTLGSLEDMVGNLADESSDPVRQPDTEDAGAYSLASLALGRSQSSEVAESSPRPAEPMLDPRQIKFAAKESTRQTAGLGSADQDDIRRQMEAALSDQGLKELIMETMRKESNK